MAWRRSGRLSVRCSGKGGRRQCCGLRVPMGFPPVLLGLPAFPVLGDSHAVFSASFEAFGPFLCCRGPKTQRMGEFLRYLLYMLLIVVFPHHNICGRSCRLQRICWDVVVVVGKEHEWEGWPQCGSGREE